MPKITIATKVYEPFVMGGDVWQPRKCEVNAKGPFKVGKGFSVFVVKNGLKLFHIVDSTSGCLCQHGATQAQALANVERDIEDCKDIKLMKCQVGEAKGLSLRATLMNSKEFLRLLRKNQ